MLLGSWIIRRGMSELETWFEQKEFINQKNPRLFFHPREIWFCALGKNVGHEQNGSGESFARPVLILKKFNAHTFLAVPLTTKIKERPHYYFLENCAGKEACAILSQIRLFDRKRLINRKGLLSRKDFTSIQKAISEMVLSPNDFNSRS